MNPFAHATAAERYARGRPYFHPLVMGKIRARWPAKIPFHDALDGACGTGMSTKALLEIAENAVGTDISAGMLAQAEPHPKIRLLQAPAEDLPFPDRSFDLITICMGLHWLDQDRFLAEVKRLLRPGGVFVSYGHGFHGAMMGNPDFAVWNKEWYLKRYPAPPRKPTDEGRGPIERQGFSLEEERFTHTIPMSLEKFVLYLTTQSNVIDKVEHGKESLEGVTAWLEAGLRPFFAGQERGLEFGGHVWYCEYNQV